MFILYPILVAIPVGLLLGGSFERLGGIRVHWAWLAIAGLALQVVLFSGAGAAVVGVAGPVLYVGSTMAVLLVVLRNLRITGFALVAVGAGLNLAAILANGGCMPADPAALAAVSGLAELDPATYSNSCLPANPSLTPLTDVFHLPPALPLANVFSVGDVVIGVGIALAIVAGMRAGPRVIAALAPVGGAGPESPTA